MSGISTLSDRGFIRQLTNLEGLIEVMESGPVTFYVGFDPTADSLHCGSLMPIMAMRLLQKMGHRPIAIIGGGTTLIGDPSGKTEMRKMLGHEEISSNGEKILGQLKRYLSFGVQGKNSALFFNNAEWLEGLNYIDFLRNIGRYFKVNEMIKVDAYKQRLERCDGLSFIEFNYQLLQAYDFLFLFEEHGCALQIGGDDQWSNILAGLDLISKIHKKNAFGVTLPLLVTASGSKMGKTENGAIWLDESKTSVYDFYQYWVNTDDQDLQRFFLYFTELSIEQIECYCNKAFDILEAKRILAFEVTKLAHGDEKAMRAHEVSAALFNSNALSEVLLESMPTTQLEAQEFSSLQSISELFVIAGLATSKSDANRLIEGGGLYVDDVKVNSGFSILNLANQTDVILRKGKKTYRRISIYHKG